MVKSTGKRGGRKIGRMKRSLAHIRYNAEDRAEKNKKKGIKKHLKGHPGDKVALKALAKNK